MLLQLFHLSYLQGESSILENIHLDFQYPGIVLITGQSGSGKSTLLHLIGGIISPSHGEVMIDGISFNNKYRCNKDEMHQKEVSFIFQGYHLIDAMSVYDNLKLFGFEDKAILEVVDKVLLKNYIDAPVHQLSGGQKQRIAIARALLIQPKALLADEPTAAMDQETAKWVRTILQELAEHSLVIIVSHDKQLFLDIAQRHIELSDGKVVKDDATQVLPKKVGKNVRQFNLQGKAMWKYIRWSIQSKKGKLFLCQMAQMFTIILFLTLFAFYGGIENYLSQLRQYSFTQNQVVIRHNNYPIEDVEESVIAEFENVTGVQDVKRNKSTFALESEQELLQFQKIPDYLKATYEGKEAIAANEIMISLDLAKKIDPSLKQVVDSTLTYLLNGQPQNFKVTGYSLDILTFQHVYFTEALANQIEWQDDRDITLYFNDYKQVKDFIKEQSQWSSYHFTNEFYEFEMNIVTMVSMLNGTLAIFALIILIIYILMSYLMNYATFLQKRKEITTLRVHGIPFIQLCITYIWESVVVTLVTIVMGSIISGGVIMALNQWIPHLIDPTLKNLLVIPFNETLIEGVYLPFFPYILLALLMILTSSITVIISLIRINRKDAGQILREDDLC